MILRSTLFSLALCAACTLHAQRPTPGAPQQRSVLITGATVHVGDGKVIEDGAVGFRNGLIDHVGYSYSVKATYDTVVQATGAHLYPGLILPDNTLGLAEVDMVRASVDEAEAGSFTPEARALTAYNTDSKVIPTVRANGILLAQATPRNGVVSGTSSVVQLDAWEADDAVVAADNAVHLNWPVAFERSGWWAEPGSTFKPQEDERQARVDEVKAFFQRAKAYAAATPAVRDVRLEAMAGLFSGKKALFVHAGRAREIREAVLFARDMGVQRTVIVGGYDAWRVADLLRERKVDVVLQRLHSLPLRDDDPVDLPYRLPALLKERGVRFCLGYTGDMERMGARNLPFIAGTASAHGLTREEALKAITGDAAAVLGIEARYGTLAVGKSATLFLSTGDALDMRTNAVGLAYIDGRRVVLDDTQKQLYRQYQERYAR